MVNRHRLTFLPAEQTGVFDEGTPLRDAALELGLFIESTCAGLGTCAKCKVRVHEGVSPPSSVEHQLLTPQQIASGVRLSCQTRLTDKAACVIPQESILHDGAILTDGSGEFYPSAPEVRKFHLQLREPVLGAKNFDAGAVLLAAQKKDASITEISLEAVRPLAGLLRENDWSVTVVADGSRIVHVEPGDNAGVLFGAAVDIGTTTVAAKLIDLVHDRVVGVVSAMNPQRQYGADVVSRIQYAIDHPGGLTILHRLIIDQINDLLGQLYEQASSSPEHCWRIVVAGNTVMQHFFLNIDPRNVAHHPYVPPFQGPAFVPAREFGLAMNGAGTAYVLPNLASFVGADITAVMAALRLDTRTGNNLVVDIGTNGEMVLGNNKRLVCCSSPAGPAWEGANIAHGMRAARGAIERAEIIEGDLQFRTIGGTPPLGICGSGLLDLVCEFVRAGMIDRTGRIPGPDELSHLLPPALRSRVVPGVNGVFHIRIAPLANDQWIELTQKDIREVQLAKSAIAAGVQMLMRELEMTVDKIEHVFIAGAFGNHVRATDAIDSGLIPPVAPDRVSFIGNAALAGAEAVLRSREARLVAEELARSIEYVEISARSDFHDMFVESMHFHGTVHSFS